MRSTVRLGKSGQAWASLSGSIFRRLASVGEVTHRNAHQVAPATTTATVARLSWWWSSDVFKVAFEAGFDDGDDWAGIFETATKSCQEVGYNNLLRKATKNMQLGRKQGKRTQSPRGDNKINESSFRVSGRFENACPEDFLKNRGTKRREANRAALSESTSAPAPVPRGELPYEKVGDARRTA